MKKDEPPDPGPDSQQELLRAWEQRIDEAAGDAVAALAELLGERQAARNRLFRLSGTTVLGCRLDAILGAGGMGVTYDGIAADGARVAVKLVAGVGHTPHERFEQECRLLQNLRHDAIVRYRDHGILADGTGALVMDLVRGADLERVLLALQAPDPKALGLPAVESLLHEVSERGPQLWTSSRYRRRMLRLLASVAEGLHAAHECGVVHRDIKPANILVREDLAPVVVDFGLARDLQQRVSMTQSGLAMGTLAYMAPEQLSRDPGVVDRRTDVYAVGLLLYRALAGVDLGKEVDDVLRRRRQSFLLDARQSRELPVDVQAILYRCLDPRPDRRYGTAAELAEDLRAAAGQGAVRARRPSLLRRTLRDRSKVAAAGLLLGLTATLLAYVSWPRGREVRFASNWPSIQSRVQVDGERDLALGESLFLPAGRHDVRFLGVGAAPVQTQIEVDEGPGSMTVPLWTRGTLPGDAQGPLLQPIWIMTGSQWSPLGEGLSRDRIRVDGRLLVDPAPGADSMVLPGVYAVEATDALGRTEAQAVKVDTGPVDVQLLPAVLADVDGSFRRTWSTIGSPLPPDVRVETDAVPWFGEALPGFFPLKVDMTPCAYAPAATGKVATVKLRVEFPTGMRSAVVSLRGRCELAGQLQVTAGFEGEPLQPWPLQPDGLLAPRRGFVAAAPRRAFLVEARLWSKISAPATAFVRFLEGMAFGGHWRDEPPCFAIAADADGRAQIPSAPPTSFASKKPPMPSLVQRVKVQSSVRLEPVGIRRQPDGRRELLLRQGAAWSHNRLLRLDWPGLFPVGAIEPEVMHPRRSAPDGARFPSSLSEVPDLDGDGLRELAICDSSSEVRGAPNAGLVCLLMSKDQRVAWSWPTERTQGKHGDEEVRLFGAVGDWDGDGYPDLGVAANDAGADPALDKAGTAAILDGKTGKVLWRRQGQRDRQSQEIVDAFVRAPGERPYLLLTEIFSPPSGIIQSTQLHLFVDGQHAAGVRCPEVFGRFALVADRDKDPQIVALCVGASPRSWALERYRLVAGELELEKRKDLTGPFLRHPEDAGALPHLLGLGDLDLDGLGDFGILVTDDQDGMLKLFLVSSASLEPWLTIPLQLPGDAITVRMGELGRSLASWPQSEEDLVLLPVLGTEAAADPLAYWFYVVSRQALRAALR